MNFKAALHPVLNRGAASPAFLGEMVEWCRSADDTIFAPNELADIYGKVRAELGPWRGIIHRRAVMLEVMRVLAGFESSWDWKEGVDTSRLGADTPENEEAGAWQVSYDARRISGSLQSMLIAADVHDGITFQRKMKFDHPLAMRFVSTLMRFNTKHNGPLYKGEERNAIRSSLRGPEHSIYPWLRKDSVAEFEDALAA